MKRFIAEPLFRPDTDGLRFLPECPRMMRQFPGGKNVLAWVAIQGAVDSKQGSINLYDFDAGVNTTIATPGRPGFLAETTQPGVLVAGVERRLVVVDALSRETTETGVSIGDDERVIINDGMAVPGGLLFGTKHLEFNLPIAALYFFDTSTREVRQVLGGQICSNGKFYRFDGERITLIDIDSSPKTISRYEFSAGFKSLLHQELVTPPDALPAIPDGLKPSPDGSSVVVAYYNPAEISEGLAQEIRLSDGAVLTEWVVPGSPRVTCPEFIEITGKVRVIFTTAVEGMPAAIQRIAPQAGTMFIADTAYATVPEPPPLFPIDSLR